MSRILRVVIFPIVALFVTSQILSAQAPKTEKRIYLLDLTGSMEGRGSVHTPNILQTVKDNLAATIENIDDPNTEIVIIPFTNVPHNAIEGVASIKDSLITQIQKLGVRSGDTNIADAWSEGIKNLDNSKINYLFLLTDGLHNTGPSKQVLFERLRKWGETAPGNNEYAFYVMLTPNAKETEICENGSPGYERWGKTYYLKQMAKTVLYLLLPFDYGALYEQYKDTLHFQAYISATEKALSECPPESFGYDNAKVFPIAAYFSIKSTPKS